MSTFQERIKTDGKLGAGLHVHILRDIFTSFTFPLARTPPCSNFKVVEYEDFLVFGKNISK